MRGKDRVGVAGVAVTGITPACAGKSRQCGCQVPGGWDHPRMCGEKTFLEQTGPAGLGSPPHVRGKVIEALLLGDVAGITPACAGKRRCFAL